MNQGAYRQNLPQNPFVKVFAMIVAVLFAVAAIFLGAVVISFLVGFALLAWLIFSVRVWWMRRHMRGSGTRTRSRTQTGARSWTRTQSWTRTRTRTRR